jgi:hypothetical protein
LRSLDREGAPQAVVAWGLFRIPKGLKCVERREAGRGAGVHAPQPSSHSGRIVGYVCQSLAHASVVTIQTVEAWKHGVHRNFTDVVLFGVIGGILLALTLEKRKQSALVTQ